MTLTAEPVLGASPVLGAARVVVLSHDKRDVRGSLAEFLHFGLSIVVRDDIIAALREVVRDSSTVLVIACDIPCRTLTDVIDLAVATCGSAVLFGLHPHTDARTIGLALDAGVQSTVRLPLTGERLAHVLRQVHIAAEAREPVTAGSLIVDPIRHEVRWQGRPVDTTPREFDSLLTLARGYPHMVTLSELAAQYGPVSDPLSSVRVIVNRLRARITAVAGPDQAVIETIRGIGYRLKT